MNIIPINERHTVRCAPPSAERQQRRSYWPTVFAEARAIQGEWVKVVKDFGKSTAQQLASDIRNAHRREPDKFRVTGVESGEVWDARWGAATSQASGRYSLWIRLVSTSKSRHEATMRMLDEDIW